MPTSNTTNGLDHAPVTTISLRCGTINGSDPVLHAPNNPEHQISIFFIEIRKEFPIASGRARSATRNGAARGRRRSSPTTKADRKNLHYGAAVGKSAALPDCPMSWYSRGTPNVC